MKLSLGRILLIVFLIVLAACSIFGFVILNRSSKSLTATEKEVALENILGRKPVLSPEPTGNTQYKGKYLNFWYPLRAKIYTFSDKTVYQSPNLEVFSFDIQNPRLVFNLTVSENLANIPNVSDIAGVLFRQEPQQGYKQVELTADNKQGLAFEKNGETAEKTGFFIVNNRIYSISVTGGDYKEVVNLFDNIINTLTFK